MDTFRSPVCCINGAIVRYLCVCQNFPGQLAPIAEALARDNGNTVFVASIRQAHDYIIPNTHRIYLKKNVCPAIKDPCGYWLRILKIAYDVRKSFETAIKQGLRPEIILVQAINGIGFFLREIFPDAFIVSYADIELEKPNWQKRESFEVYRKVQEMMFLESSLMFCRQTGQKNLFPVLLREHINLLPFFVDTDFFSPDCRCPESKKNINVIAGKLTEGQLVNLCKIVGLLLLHCQDYSVIIQARDRFQQKNFLQWFAKLEAGLKNRLSVECVYSREQERQIALSSILALCPYPDWSCAQKLLAAMSCECLVMCGTECEIPAENILRLSAPDIEGQLQELFAVIDNIENFARLRKSGRNMVVRKHAQKNILPAHIRFINEAYHSSKRNLPEYQKP